MTVGMSVTKRLLAATWIFVLVMMAVFTVVHVRLLGEPSRIPDPRPRSTSV